MKTMLSLFEDSGALTDEPLRAADVDWAGLGVEKKYIIFLTGRCGSTWLTHLLADTGYLGKPEELFNEEFIPFITAKTGVSTLRAYLPEVIRRYKGDKYFGFEIDAIRYSALAAVTRFQEVFLSGSTATFFMTRTDILSQAYSFAMAKRTGNWHSFAGKAEQEEVEGASIDDRAIWVELFLILEQEVYLREQFRLFGIKPIPITYEEMALDKYSVLTTIMTALGVKPAEISAYLEKVFDKTKKLTHESKHRFIGEFLERNWPTFQMLMTHRQEPDIDELRKELKGRENIDVGPFHRLRRP